MEITLQRILDLVTEGLSELEAGSVPLSSIIRKSIRVARLRNDYESLLWLQMEMISFEDKEAKLRVVRELAPHFSKSQFEELRRRHAETTILERRMRRIDLPGKSGDDEKALPLGVEELENRLDQLESEHAAAVPPQGLHTLDLYYAEKQRAQIQTMTTALIADTRDIMSRIRQRVHDFLSTTEKQLLYGQVNADIFEQNRRFVDSRMQKLAPEVFDKFVVVYQRMSDGDPEARSHAITSCRRILKALADAVYPASNEKVVGIDDKERKLTENKYISRLWQFVSDRVGGKSSGDLLLACTEDLGNRLDKAYDLQCKGVHDEVTEFEVNQCVIQTYLLVGDILRIYDADSAIESVS